MSDGAKAAEDILRANGFTNASATAIILGTGLGAMADEASRVVVVPYEKLPGFPRSGVSGHVGRMLQGEVAGQRVILLQGRAHYYESGDARAMAVPLEALAAFGVTRLILTNAAGSLRPDWPAGTIAVLRDHINFAGVNPLIGAGTDHRFVNLIDAYDPTLRMKMHRAAKAMGLPMCEGVYMWFSGPSFETPAEIGMARKLGAHLVGMSTVPEVILARYLGMKVVALSLVTNLGAGMKGSSPSHQETKAVAAKGAAALRSLIETFLGSPDGE